MSTTSIVPTAIDALLSGIESELGVSSDVVVHEEWPGPDAGEEMVLLGEIVWEDYRIPTVMRSRHQRQEDVDIEFFVVVAGASGTTPSNVKPVRDRAFVLLKALEDLLADDPFAGITDVSLQGIELRPGDAGARVFERAWAYRITGNVHVSARLV